MDLGPRADDRIFTGDNNSLEDTMRKMMLEEVRIWLLKELMRQGLCTRDVYSFAVKQAGLRSSFKSIDEATIRQAMLSKIRDCRATLKRLKGVRALLETNLSTESERERLKLKTIKNKLGKKIRQERKKILIKYANKIDHYKKTQTKIVNTTETTILLRQITRINGWRT